MLPSTSNDATEAYSSTTFFLFNNLPLEVRRLIWLEALPGPRIVHLQPGVIIGGGCTRVRSDVNIYEPKSEKQFFDDPYFHNIVMGNPRTCPRRLHGLRAYEPTPAALLVCRESHDVASKIYTKAFRFTDSFASVWFSFERDTIYLTQDTFESLDDEFLTESLLREDLCKVQRVALGLEARDYDGQLINRPIEATPFLDIYNYGVSSESLIDFFSGLKSLKELTVAQNYHYHSAHSFGLKMIDRIDYPKALELFNNPFSRQADKEFLHAAVQFQKFVDDEVSIDMELWVDLQSEAKEKFDDRHALLDYALPKITHKIVLPPQELLAYLELKAAYDQKKLSHMELLKIKTSINYNYTHEMSYLANRSTTIDDLRKALRTYWPLKSESRLVVLIHDPHNKRNHNVIMADPEALVFELLDEMPAAEFRIHYSDDKECTELSIRNQAPVPTGIYE